jgi:hypothetical protein
MLALLRNQLTDEDLEPEAFSDTDDLEASMEAALTALEHDLDSSMTRDEVYLRILDLFSTRRVRSSAEILGRVFPVVPAAITAIYEFLYAGLQDIVSWIEVHATVSDVRERAAQLRKLADEVHAMHTASPQP